MKKILVLVTMATLVSTSAFAASVAGSLHDMTGSGGVDEVCVYCHTPHNATAAIAPLWNRGYAPATITPYTSANVTSAIVGDVGLCLSCHDGTTGADGAIVNVPAGKSENTAGISPNIITGTLGGDANLGTNLSNDHPVGFTYATAQTAGGLKATVDNGAMLHQGQVWCSSCHNVHDNVEVPFLRATNGGSALCLGCHIK